jgi:hypothetical protein
MAYRLSQAIPVPSESEIDEILLAEPGLRKRGYKTRLKPQEPGAVAYRVERARYANLESGFRDRVFRKFAATANDPKSIIEYTRWFSEQLYRYQVKMYVVGRRTMGDFSNSLSEEERKMLHGAHSRQMRFFHSFMRDVLTGGGRMDYQERMDMYALSGYSLYLRGAVSVVPDLKFYWVVNDEVENCLDCLARQQLSRLHGGFSVADLERIGYPGEGKTVCLTRCRCHLEPIGGARSLPRTRSTGFRARYGQQTEHAGRYAKTKEARAGRAGRQKRSQ